METRLRQAGLWCKKDEAHDIDISIAWDVLSRLGRPVRYGGRAQDGSYVYIVTDPETGEFLATGKGTTLEMSMCDAALKAGSAGQSNRLNNNPLLTATFGLKTND